ncbi:MAG TPA: enoyl-CoA hydratase/isomerase family protein [Oculatellaceae cyanobacterium]
MTLPGKDIQYVLDHQVGVITLNRPESRNAITTEMWKALPAVIDNLQEFGARVLIITGSGDAFASGADLNELSKLETHEHAAEFWTAIEECLTRVEHSVLPTIAMINGACIGGGCLLATACDLRYAASSANFAIPVARLGIILDDQSIGRLVTLVGAAVAKEMIFTGRSLTAEEAERRGLVNQVFPDENLATEVQKIGAAIVLNETVALFEAKRAVQRFRAKKAATAKHRKLIIDSYLSTELRNRVGRILKELQD